MRITDLLKKEAIELGASVSTKNEAIDKLISLHEKAGNLNDVQAYKAAILERENQGSTAIGEGIAVPHAKSESVKVPGLSAITLPNGVDYGAPDGKASDILFMIAAPLDGDLHLEILSRLMVMLMEPEFCADLRKAATADEFLQIIDKKESEKYPSEPKEEPAVKQGYRILAVTHAPPVLPILIWLPRHLKRREKKWAIPLRLKQTVQAVPKTFLQKKKLKSATV